MVVIRYDDGTGKRVDDASVRAADWTLGGVDAESVDTLGTVDAAFQVRIDVDMNGPAGTGTTDVTYRRGTTADAAGNLLSTVRAGDVAESDGAAPVVEGARSRGGSRRPRPVAPPPNFGHSHGWAPDRSGQSGYQ